MEITSYFHTAIEENVKQRKTLASTESSGTVWEINSLWNIISRYAGVK